MGEGFFSVSGWIRPMGFVRNERQRRNGSLLDHGSDIYEIALRYALLLVADILTLPLAALLLLGMGTDDRDSE